MTAPASSPQRFGPATWLGLFIALFGMLIARQVVNYLYPNPTFASAVIKEAGMWLVALSLFVIIKVGEGLPLTSIGLGTARWGKSILWGFLLGIACLLVGGLLVVLTGYTGGETGKAFDKLPTWLLSLIVLRAGVVEELCYRGYAIERLHALGLPRGLAAGRATLHLRRRPLDRRLGQHPDRPSPRRHARPLLHLAPRPRGQHDRPLVRRFHRQRPPQTAPLNVRRSLLLLETAALRPSLVWEREHSTA